MASGFYHNGLEYLLSRCKVDKNKLEAFLEVLNELNVPFTEDSTEGETSIDFANATFIFDYRTGEPIKYHETELLDDMRSRVELAIENPPIFAFVVDFATWTMYIVPISNDKTVMHWALNRLGIRYETKDVDNTVKLYNDNFIFKFSSEGGFLP